MTALIRNSLIACAAIVALAACGDDGVSMTVDQLQDPTTCMACHPTHSQQWSASMHAYASDDPVFVAMNKRGQRETSNMLGTFCVECHAPMAVQLGLTDGTNFDPTQLPAKARGITCYFCHNVKQVTDDHNGALVLANDQTMHGGVTNPVRSPAHHSAYDKLMDSTVNESEICGSCHDVVTQRGVALERTFQEWKTTFFSADDPLHHLSCGSCHMMSSTGVIADGPGLNVPSRNDGLHEHLWPGIDQALTTFPGMDVMAAGIKRDLDGAIAIIGPSPLTSPIQAGGICLDPPGVLSIRMDSIAVAHAWPSGAAQDRRAWLEVKAYNAETEVDDGTNPTLVFHSGIVPDPPQMVDPDDVLKTDPSLFGLWDRTFKDDGTPAHFFWEVATETSMLLKPPTTLDKNSPAFDHSTTVKFTIPNYTAIDHIKARIRIRPLSYAMLADLVSSGDLDPSIPAQMQTLDIAGTMSEWKLSTKGTGPAMNTNCNPQ